MKTLYTLFISMILSCIMCLPVSTEASTDTIASFPFVEDWSSLSFDTNGWTFPYTQGNWAISTGEGNPAPCAVFTGYPSNSNYSFTLESEVYDVSALTCDEVFLKFDLHLSALNLTGLEKISVYAMHDSTQDILMSIRNFDSIIWHTYETKVLTGSERIFRIRFVAVGQYSPSIETWSLDNIIVEGRCKTVSYQDITSNGACLWSSSGCITRLSWGKPTCTEPAGTLYEYIFDDGTAETGWAVNTGAIGWLGNEFPVPDWSEGVIQSFDIWFGFGASTADSLALDVFDATQQIVGSTPPFLTENSDWVTVYCNIPFHGLFYAMIRWVPGLSPTNYLGYDEDGPYSSENLEWYYDGTTWDKLTNAAGSEPGVFLIRANVMLNGKEGRLTPEGTFAGNPDSTIIAGYNIYRKDEGFLFDTAFHLVGYVPAPDTVFQDTISCLAFYNVTCVFSNNCESEPVSFGSAGCWTWIPENSSGINIRIIPNPATDAMRVISEESFDKVIIYDQLGKKVRELDCPHSTGLTCDISAIPDGFYLLAIQSAHFLTARRLIIRR